MRFAEQLVSRERLLHSESKRLQGGNFNRVHNVRCELADLGEQPLHAHVTGDEIRGQAMYLIAIHHRRTRSEFSGSQEVSIGFIIERFVAIHVIRGRNDVYVVS